MNSINPLSILTSKVEDSHTILGPTLIPKEMKDIVIFGNKPEGSALTHLFAS